MTLTFHPRSQISKGSSQCCKQPFSENLVQIDLSVRLEFCSQAESDTQTNCRENITLPRFCGGVMNEWVNEWMNLRMNKKHSENADTSTFVTFDLDVWPWPYFKVKKTYIISCRVLYCALVPGMMSVSVIICEIWPLVPFMTFDLHLWPSAYVKVTFTQISRCTSCSCTLVQSMKYVGSIESEIWTIVYWKLKWRHNDVITHSNLIKFKHKYTKGISER